MRKKLLFTLILAVIAGATALLIAEAIVRHGGGPRYPTPAVLANRTLEYIPALFARHVFPPKELRASNEDEANPVEYYINEKGYRGRNFTASKPEGAIRIIFYGGSATFDVNLPEGRDWPHRVEAILRENGFSQVEVINAGVPGHASWDSFGRLFAEGHHFDPDYVVASNGWNDFRYFRSDQPLLREFKPLNHSSRVADPRLHYRNFIDRILSEHSQLYLRLRSRYIDWRLGIGPLGVESSGPRSSQITEAALRQFRLNQKMLIHATRETGAVPLLMTEPRLTAPGNTEMEKSRIEPYLDNVKLTHEGLVRAYDEIEGILREVSLEEKVELIDTGAELNGRSEFFADVVHLTPEGSEKLAQLTAQKLMEVLKTREPRTP